MNKFQNIKSFIKGNEKRLSFGALLIGFLVDNFTLTRIDLLFDNLILLTYLFIAGISIFLIHTLQSERLKIWLLYIMQFAFGGLFSGYIIFYSRSASLNDSWLFLLILIILLVGNEFFKRPYQRLTFQMSVFFVAIFSFFIFFVPVIVGKMGGLIFLLSGLFSLVVITLMIYTLGLVIKTKQEKWNKNLKISIGIIFILFNIFYFTNIIPPVPLSLKELGIYYNVERNVSGDYILYSEDLPWYQFYKSDEFKYVEGAPLFSYSSVFAPTKIKDEILHQWSYFDEQKNDWTVINRIKFSIAGGRDGGYRGYSFKENLMSGKWRVDVMTERGQRLGRTTFTVISSDIEPILKQNIR